MAYVFHYIYLKNSLWFTTHSRLTIRRGRIQSLAWLAVTTRMFCRNWNCLHSLGPRYKALLCTLVHRQAALHHLEPVKNADLRCHLELLNSNGSLMRSPDNSYYMQVWEAHLISWNKRVLDWNKVGKKRVSQTAATCKNSHQHSGVFFFVCFVFEF